MASQAIRLPNQEYCVQNFDPDKVTNRVLHETFEQYGAVLSAKVAVDSAGRSKGYGFIQYENPESADKAIEGLNNSFLHGQALFVGPFVPAKVKAQSFQLIVEELQETFVKHGHT